MQKSSENTGSESQNLILDCSSGRNSHEQVIENRFDEEQQFKSVKMAHLREIMPK